MPKHEPTLQSTEHSQVITMETVPQFLYLLQQGLLLALKEQGYFSEPQFHQVLDSLRRQFKPLLPAEQLPAEGSR